MIGWIYIYDIRFGYQFTATENFSTLLGIILGIFSVVFPVLLAVIYKKGYKPLRNNNHNDSKILLIDKKKYGSLKNYNKKT